MAHASLALRGPSALAGSSNSPAAPLRAPPLQARALGFAESVSSCPSLRTSAASHPPLRQRGSHLAAPRAAQEVRTEQKVRVVLGPYRDGAIAATAPAARVTPEEAEKAWQERKGRTHEFERINFTGTGAALGHTVKINFEGVYAEGPQAGQTVRGTKADGYELELKTREDEPWRTFVQEITVAGMGQEESKTFLLQFPADYKAPSLAGVKARFTVTVKAIGMKKELPKDTRTEVERKAAVAQELQASAEQRANEAVDRDIRVALLATSEAAVEKMAASVTWAKFGEKSLQDYKWNLLQEEVARVEGIAFDQVLPFLRSQAKITYT